MPNNPHVAVILAGSGRHDGSEIHESVCTLLSLDQQNATYQCLAPDKPQRFVFDHIKEQPTNDPPRNQMTEAARIARGNIKPIESANPQDFDAIIIPGGDGTAKNLNTFAIDGPDCSVDPDVANFLTKAHAAAKPIGFVCIAPALCAAVFGKSHNPTVTIGSNQDVANALATLNTTNDPKPATDITIDNQNRFVSTPAYMEASGPAEVYQGINKLVTQVLAMTQQPANA